MGDTDDNGDVPHGNGAHIMDFGTSGLRGRVEDMTDAACARWTGAFLAHLEAGGAAPGPMLIGRDLRPSSPRIAAACAGAAVAAGWTAVDCGAIPTPALALEALRRGAPAAMVTGSHIPFDRNGIKFYGPAGEIAKTDEAGIRAAHDAAPARAPAPARPGGGTRTETAAAARWLARALDAFPAGNLAGRRIGVHQHSAVGRDLLVEALERAGVAVVPLGRSEAFIPIDTEAIEPAHAAQLAAWAAEHALDAVVSTDGDGDRPLVADEAGHALRGDALGVLVARALGADAVATPVSSTTALERSGWFVRVARTRIGSPFVIEAMAGLAADGARLPVGFEANGGFLTGADAAGPSGAPLAALPTRDALLPILAALHLAGDGPVSALRDLLPARATASDRIKETPPEMTGPLLERLAGDAAARAAFVAPLGLGDPTTTDLTDGVRMTFADGRILHLRRSGNAPEMRGYAEAETQAQAEALAAKGLRLARAQLFPAGNGETA
jgi:phosphomannomutase